MRHHHIKLVVRMTWHSKFVYPWYKVYCTRISVLEQHIVMFGEGISYT